MADLIVVSSLFTLLVQVKRAGDHRSDKKCGIAQQVDDKQGTHHCIKTLNKFKHLSPSAPFPGL